MEPTHQHDQCSYTTYRCTFLRPLWVAVDSHLCIRTHLSLPSIWRSAHNKCTISRGRHHAGLSNSKGCKNNGTQKAATHPVLMHDIHLFDHDTSCCIQAPVLACTAFLAVGARYACVHRLCMHNNVRPMGPRYICVCYVINIPLTAAWQLHSPSAVSLSLWAVHHRYTQRIV